MRRRSSLFLSAPFLLAGALWLGPDQAEAQQQRHVAQPPSVQSLTAHCPPRGAPPQLTPYRLPSWVLRGLTAPPSGPLADLNPLEARLEQLSTDDPHRGDLLLKLGDTYLDHAERGPEQTRDDFRRRAIKVLALMLRDDPDHQQDNLALQRLAYGLGQEAQAQTGQRSTSLHHQVRQVYHRLIKSHPQSRFIPHAYTYFGDYYFDEGDLAAALQFYDRAVRVPTQGSNPLRAYALYKSGRCALRLGDRQGARQRFHQAIVHLATHPTTPDAAALERHARAGLCRAREVSSRARGRGPAPSGRGRRGSE